MIRTISIAALAATLAASAHAACDIAECNPQVCENFAIQHTLPGFPAHETETTSEQREEIGKIALALADQARDPGAYQCARIMGHSSSWRQISADEYDRRALERARVVAELMAASMETTGLAPVIVAKEDLDGEQFCEATGEEDFVLIYDGRGNACPKVDNQVDSVSRAARDARFINRRVEMYLVRKGKPIEVKVDWDAPCSDVISADMLCVEVQDGIYQGTRCSSDDLVDVMNRNSRETLLEMVENGEAKLICRPAG